MGCFVDRNYELRKLAEALTDQTATLVLVSGAPKIGKTSLLQQFDARCRELGIPHASLRLTGRHSIESIVATLVDRLTSSLSDTPGKDVRSIRLNFRRLIEETGQGIGRASPGAQLPTREAGAYNLANVRKMLHEAFTSEALARFCSDRTSYRPITLSVDAHASLDGWIDGVLSYCQTHDLLPAFLEEVNQERHRIYLKWQDRLEDTLGDLTTQVALSTSSTEADDSLAVFDYFYKRDTAENFQRGLQLLDASRIAISFDSYDSCRAEVKRWLVNTFLDCIRRDTRIVVVVAVTEETEFADKKEEIESSWGGTVVPLPLGPITNLDAWLQWVEKTGLPADMITTVRYLFHRHRGYPREMATELALLERYHIEGVL